MINGRKLNENISPNQRRLRLKELSGQKLTNKEKDNDINFVTKSPCRFNKDWEA